MPPSARSNERAARVIRWIERFCRHTKGEWAGKPLELAEWEREIVRGIFGPADRAGRRHVRTALIGIPRKNGKALAPETPIVTPAGWTTLGHLEAGSIIFDNEGRPCTVTAVADWHDRPRAAVEFDDGDIIVADLEHEWPVHYYDTTKIVTTAHLAKLVAGPSSPSIDVAAALEQPPTMLPIDPYTFGIWLGDGHTDAGRITNQEPEVWSEIESAGWKLGAPPPSAPLTRTVFGLVVHLRNIGVLGAKHIPLLYLRASAEQRRALLAGIIDSDGHVTSRGQCEITLTNARLTDDVVELVRTLGYKPRVSEADATINGRIIGRRYRLQFWPFTDDKLARVPRKAARMHDRPQRRTRSMRRHVVAVHPMNPGPTRCIEVDSSSHLFLAGRSMTPTHNSTLAAALGLYLLLADFEQGAEVYSAAADKDQARIVFDMAKAMVQSGPLDKYVKVCKNWIEVPQTASIYRVLSADAPTKHGLNPHGVVFDELHAQPNRDLWDVLTSGQGARRQPLTIAITTAGFDRQTICYEQYDYGRKVSARIVKDPSFYFRWWGVDAAKPTDTTWHEPDRWAEVNPSWEHIPTLPAFIKAEATKAKHQPARQNMFRRLYMNEWTQAESRWMDLGAWDRTAGLVNEHALAGRVCCGGLDLASTTDIAALCWNFPNEHDDGHQAIWRFFIAQEQLTKLDDRTAGQASVWARDGFLTINDGNVIDYDAILLTIEADRARFDIRRLAFDRWGMDGFQSRLDNAGIDLDLAAFGQGYASMSWPTKEMERLVLEGKYAHGGNPVMRWMVDNVVARQDPAGNIKPDKQKSTEKIDGVVAAIMALDASARLEPAKVSAYETHGLQTVG